MAIPYERRDSSLSKRFQIDKYVIAATLNSLIGSYSNDHASLNDSILAIYSPPSARVILPWLLDLKCSKTFTSLGYSPYYITEWVSFPGPGPLRWRVSDSRYQRHPPGVSPPTLYRRYLAQPKHDHSLEVPESYLSTFFAWLVRKVQISSLNVQHRIVHMA